MIHAYNELYLCDAKDSLSDMIYYAVNDYGLDADWFASLFVITGYAQKFETGNPSIIAGMSGIELARLVIEKAYNKTDFPPARYSDGASPEYWAGWVLAEYQWYTGRRFRDIFERIPLSSIIAMYPVYHEMDITAFIRDMEYRYSEVKLETKLKRIRENRGFSQSELAEYSGVSLHSIQMYEQKSDDIDKAQAHMVYKLSRALGCSVEDLLENPMC